MTKRIMTSSKPCNLNPNQRAYATQILDANFSRAGYDRKYSEVQRSRNYRIKLTYFKVMPTKAKIDSVLNILRDAGYTVDATVLASAMRPGSRPNSVAFMFKAVSEDNKVKIVSGYGSDGQPLADPASDMDGDESTSTMKRKTVDDEDATAADAFDIVRGIVSSALANRKYQKVKEAFNKEGDLTITVVRLKSTKKTEDIRPHIRDEVKKAGLHVAIRSQLSRRISNNELTLSITVPSPIKESELAYPQPQRNINVNNGLPNDVHPRDINVLSVVLVWFNDAPPANVMVTEVNRPVTGKRGKPSTRGEIDYRGFDSQRNEVRFTSSQVLLVREEADFAELFAGANAPLSKKAARVYDNMLAKGYMIATEPYNNEHEVVEGTHSCMELTRKDFILLSRQPNMEKRCVMTPGCAPGWYLVHRDNQHAIRYEVEIEYVNRIGEIEF